MHLYPASFLITAAVFIPNLIFLALPPRKIEKHGNSPGSLPFTILERVGQAGSFVLPIFFPLSFSGPFATSGWIVMGLTLAFYYAGWARYLFRGRDYAFLFKPTLGIPVPMAVSPVLYFLVSSVVLGSICQAIAAVVLGIGHITISTREYLRLKAASSL